MPWRIPQTTVSTTFTLSKLSDRDTVITYKLTDLGVGNGGHGVDYKLNPLPFTVTIPAFQSSATVSLDALEDQDLEPNQTVRLEMTNATGNPDVTFSTTPADITILDDGDGIKVNIVKVNDGNEPTTNASFKLFLTKQDGVTPYAAPLGLTVGYIIGGTAKAGAGLDYTGLSGSHSSVLARVSW